MLVLPEALPIVTSLSRKLMECKESRIFHSTSPDDNSGKVQSLQAQLQYVLVV